MSGIEANLQPIKDKTKRKKRKTPKPSLAGSNNEIGGDIDEEQTQNIKKKKTNLSNNGRDYSGDLREYLTDWKRRDKTQWKFSKVIQSWALLNCFSSDKVSDEIFDMLLPYISTVQGGARNRIIEVVTNIISIEDDLNKRNQIGDSQDDDCKSYEMRQARAKAILKVLNI